MQTSVSARAYVMCGCVRDQLDYLFTMYTTCIIRFDSYLTGDFILKKTLVYARNSTRML